MDIHIFYIDIAHASYTYQHTVAIVGSSGKLLAGDKYRCTFDVWGKLLKKYTNYKSTRKHCDIRNQWL